MRLKHVLFIFLLQTAIAPFLPAQSFYFGADLSYVNEIEDCGVVYKENQTPKDPYKIFTGHGCNLVRLRLWHTPAWYDALNSGKRYSDLADVKKSIARAKAAGMQVLLDFHLSDNWADPSKQRVPAAWLPVVNNLPVLQDSLKNYIYNTLLDLAVENLLPEMVQIGNETNKGILLSPQDDANGWVLNWPRNAALFNTAIQAVRDVENHTGKSIKIALHIAGPGDADWLAKAFHDNGVTDFDVIGLSYYWSWHKPITIANTGGIIAGLRQKYPGKQVMIFETGYIWTTAAKDAANNIINNTDPAYQPVTPQNQKKWLTDLTQEVINKGGSGVIYWEPAWVSSGCRTQWGLGSHQENAAFFDFGNNLLLDGGIGFMTNPYANLTAAPELPAFEYFRILSDSGSMRIQCAPLDPAEKLYIQVTDVNGQLLAQRTLDTGGQTALDVHMALPDHHAGVFFVKLWQEGGVSGARKVWLE
ncbi:MAG: arabinogalactan endo-1,4-beta-galactosidase [Thermoanaerobaculia bacterium]|nr:arabinogalactan endo-1,4-beta-galactosidase [Thermoanaerobaculia bacterium]